MDTAISTPYPAIIHSGLKWLTEYIKVVGNAPGRYCPILCPPMLNIFTFIIKLQTFFLT